MQLWCISQKRGCKARVISNSCGLLLDYDDVRAACAKDLEVAVAEARDALTGAQMESRRVSEILRRVCDGLLSACSDPVMTADHWRGFARGMAESALEVIPAQPADGEAKP